LALYRLARWTQSADHQHSHGQVLGGSPILHKSWQAANRVWGQSRPPYDCTDNDL